MKEPFWGDLRVTSEGASGRQLFAQILHDPPLGRNARMQRDRPSISPLRKRRRCGVWSPDGLSIDLHSSGVQALVSLQRLAFGIDSRMLRVLLCLVLAGVARAEPPEPPEGKLRHGRPALIGTDKLREFDALPDDRKRLIEGAIAVARDSPWLPYLFGGSDPKDGGFDCSGAMFFVMRRAGLEPPRSSAGQFLWLKRSKRLIEIPVEATTLEHPVWKKLQPGDLVFWGGTYAPVDGRSINITHVALFLGHEAEDGRAVMINATDGRTYRGKKANGYGVYDFQMPRAGSKGVLLGYGTPPGIAIRAE